MTPYRVVIADDEPLAREGIRDLLADESGDEVEVVALCGDGEETVTACREYAPDILFLDVEMPGMDGIETLRKLGPQTPRVVIFVTAFDHYAVAAFEHEALDYLTKPVDRARFRASFRRALEHLRTQERAALDQKIAAFLRATGRGAPERLTIRSEGETIWVDVDAVRRFQAADYYVEVHAAGRVHLLRESLDSLEERFGGDRFLRVHRSHLVSVARIVRLQTTPGGEARLVLDGGDVIPVSRGRLAELRRRLG